MWACGCIMGELLLHKPLLPGKDEIDQVLSFLSALYFHHDPHTDTTNNSAPWNSNRKDLAWNVAVANNLKCLTILWNITVYFDAIITIRFHFMSQFWPQKFNPCFFASWIIIEIWKLFIFFKLGHTHETAV